MVKKNARVKMDGVGSTVMASTYFPLTVDVSINVDYWAEHSSLVCETDDACANFPLPGGDSSIPGGSDTTNMTCYKGGDAVFNNHQMCDVTSTQYHINTFERLISS